MSLPTNKISAALTALFLLSIYLCWPKVYVGVQSQDQRLNCVINTVKFSLVWRHSVEKTLWQENYQLQAQQLWLDTTVIQGFGAGVPSDLILHQQNKNSIELQVQRALPELNWVVSRHMQGQIRVLEHIWPIAEQVSNYETIQIRPRRLMRWQAWQRGECL